MYRIRGLRVRKGAGPVTSYDTPQQLFSKTEFVMQRLRDDIAAGLIEPGESLKQANIAKRYGVSATPVREALRLLEAAGTISYLPHRGATVTELTDTEKSDVYLLRSHIEGLATGLAATRHTEAQLAGIKEMQARLRATDISDGLTLGRLNRQLHFAIFNAGSEIAANQAAGLWALFPAKITVWWHPDSARSLMDEHDAIIAAIEKRDEATARELASAHIKGAAAIREGRPVE